MSHVSVLLNELVDILNIKPGGLYLDCTFGAGGHSRKILELGGKVIGIDRDLNVKKFADQLLKDFPNSFQFYNAKFSEIDSILPDFNFDGIFYDFGVSSMQLDEEDRGFSFSKEGPLDMGMGFNKISAYDVINKKSEKELSDIFFKFGNEKFSRLIAKNILIARKKKLFETTLEFGDFIKKLLPFYNDGIHPATRVFQAIRIFINDELNEIEKSLDYAVNFSKSGTIIAAISFHSLEDSIVKHLFKKYSKDSIKFNRRDKMIFSDLKNNYKVEILNKKPIVANEEEIFLNPRSRSAKLRACKIL